MTKAREPMSFHDAITKVVGLLGWAGAADAAGKSERTVRNWSDPDTAQQPTIEEALRLDAAFVAAGGTEPPILTAYSLRLDVATATVADPRAIAASMKTAAREAAEAMGAMGEVLAQPNADPLILAAAQRECMEAGEAFVAAARRLGKGGEK
jgi:hypothetical protein